CILIHELGHFFVGRWCGIRVEKFSIGYGKALIKKTVNGTTYQLGVFPLGGFVKFAGEDNTGKMVGQGKEGEFYSAKPWKRILTIFAGPFMNFILGVVIFIIMFTIGFNMKTLDNRIVLDRFDKDEKRIIMPAEKAGLRDEDIITAVDNKPVSYWHEIQEILIRSDKERIQVRVKRDNIEYEYMVDTVVDPKYSIRTLGIIPYFPAKIGYVLPDNPAENILKKDDVILKINNTKVNNWYDFTHLIRKNANKELVFSIIRGNGKELVKITPRDKEGKGFIGVSVPDVTVKVFKRYNFFSAVYRGVQESVFFIGITFWGFGKLLSGQIKNPRNAVGGPIMIAKMAGDAARDGVSTFFDLMARISITLMIMNLLPIPILDGSHILFYTIEIIRGKPINEKILETVFQIGFLILILLFVYVIYNDIARLDTIKSLLNFFRNILVQK
ncbi:MAG: RIP metalloprotease RseP, partial [Actinomycetia bacterium]|nr:RIP metalloprotease RseP [Actinomycetes bacterium]